jgi:hypothetical protein
VNTIPNPEHAAHSVDFPDNVQTSCSKREIANRGQLEVAEGKTNKGAGQLNNRKKSQEGHQNQNQNKK